MFKSATIRLTGWYVLILMTLSIIFSVIIYQVASDEIKSGLEIFETSLLQKSSYFNFTYPINNIIEIRNIQANQAMLNILIKLVYFNLILLVIGSIVSYYLARRSLIPIEEAHEAQSRFTSDASHELRTPLAVMKTELEAALMDKNATTEDLRRVLVSNIEEVDKLSKLAQMLLGLSKYDHSNIELKPINLYKTAARVIKDFKLPSTRINIKSKKRLMINGNETAIGELIKILIDNALQYSPLNSRIDINLSRHDNCVSFKISNTGPGIKEDDLPYIFDRFYRADQSRTKGDHKGYGLGLSLAKRIAEIHDGSISASSIPEKETSFTFLIPVFKK